VEQGEASVLGEEQSTVLSLPMTADDGHIVRVKESRPVSNKNLLAVKMVIPSQNLMLENDWLSHIFCSISSHGNSFKNVPSIY
jgi:hypothetical protein